MILWHCLSRRIFSHQKIFYEKDIELIKQCAHHLFSDDFFTEHQVTEEFSECVRKSCFLGVESDAFTVVPAMNGHPRDQAKVSVHCRWPLIRGMDGHVEMCWDIDNVAVHIRWPLTTGVAQGRYYCTSSKTKL